MTNKKRSHSFNWLKRQFRNVGIEYTLLNNTIFLKKPLFYSLTQDASNPNYFKITHPDCFGRVSICIAHNYDFQAFINKLLRYEQTFFYQIFAYKTLRQTLQPRDEDFRGKLGDKF